MGSWLHNNGVAARANPNPLALDSYEFLNAGNVFNCVLWQLVPGADLADVRLPPRYLLIFHLHSLQCSQVPRQGGELLAIYLVFRAQLDGFQVIKDIKLGEVDVSQAIDPAGQ